MLLLVIGIRFDTFFRLSLFIPEKEDKKDPVLLEQVRMAYADHVLSRFAGFHPWAAVWHVWDNLVFESPLPEQMIAEFCIVEKRTHEDAEGFLLTCQ
jgi:hypothetical protein